MKILIDVRLLSKGKTSGIEEYTQLLLHSLFTEDAKNEYLLFYNGFKKAALPEAWKAFPHVSLINTRIPNKLLEGSLKFLHWPPIEYFTKTDIVFSPHFNLLRIKGNAKRILTFHDLSFVHFPEFYPWRKRYWHWTQNCREQAHDADKLIAVSEFTKYDLVNTFGVPEEKVSVIYSAVNPFYRVLQTNDLHLHQFQKKHNLYFPFLLYVGVLEPRKNITAIIRAFNILKQNGKNPDLRLLIVGERGWLYDKILNEAYHSPNSDSIIFWGKASYEELLYLYNLTRVFVYPSFFEGFGFPPLEAQSCGAPVVASNRTSLPEILGDSALLVDPWRIDELVIAIDEFLKNDTLRRTFQENGFKNIKRFSWHTSVEKCLKLFR